MDAAELDRVLTAKLLSESSEAITTVAMELASLYDAWVARGDDADSVAWLRGVLERLGWWSGRLRYAVDPALLSRFPTFD